MGAPNIWLLVNHSSSSNNLPQEKYKQKKRNIQSIIFLTKTYSTIFHIFFPNSFIFCIILSSKRCMYTFNGWTLQCVWMIFGKWFISYHMNWNESTNSYTHSPFHTLWCQHIYIYIHINSTTPKPYFNSSPKRLIRINGTIENNDKRILRFIFDIRCGGNWWRFALLKHFMVFIENVCHLSCSMELNWVVCNPKYIYICAGINRINDNLISKSKFDRIKKKETNMLNSIPSPNVINVKEEHELRLL